MTKIIIKQLVFIIISLILSSCALYGPIYKKPKVETPTQWHMQDNLSKSSEVNLPSLAWWEQFHDNTLNQLIHLAIEQNNDIQVAAGQVLDAQGELMQVQYSIVPSVNALLLGYAATRSIFLYNNGFSSGIIPEYALNLFQYLRSSEKAKAELAKSQATQDAVTLSVISQTAAGYFAYAGQSLLAEQQTTLVRDLETLLELSRKQYQEGLISLYTLQQYEQDYEQAKSVLPIIQNNVVIARNAIRLLLNENPGYVKIGSQFMSIESRNLVPVNLPAKVLANRPDVRDAEQKLIAANARVGIVTSTFFPTISITNITGSVSREFTNLFSQNNNYANTLSLFTAPLLAPEYPGQHKSAKGLRYAAYHDYIQVIRNAFKSVEDDLSAHQEYEQSLVSQGKNYASSDKAFELARSSFQQGLYSYPTLLVNKVNYDHAAIEYTKSKIAQLTTIVKLYQDLGAGYSAYTKDVA